MALTKRDTQRIVFGMMTHRDIVNLWPTATALASDIGASEITVRQWRNRNSIPARHWQAVLRAADERGLNLCSDDLINGVGASPAPTGSEAA